MPLLRWLSLAAPLLIFACAEDDAKAPSGAEPEVTSAKEDTAPVAPPPPEVASPAPLPVTSIEQTAPPPPERVACARDVSEPNDRVDQAISLGSVGDTDAVAARTIARPNLTTSDGDEDWFVLTVRDAGLNGNPEIAVVTTDRRLEVTVMYQCANNQDFSTCDAGEPDATHGAGCRSVDGVTTLETSCAGLDESGTAYIRVRPALATGACHTYDLTVTVS